jgi:hypothetical protein
MIAKVRRRATSRAISAANPPVGRGIAGAGAAISLGLSSFKGRASKSVNRAWLYHYMGRVATVWQGGGGGVQSPNVTNEITLPSGSRT